MRDVGRLYRQMFVFIEIVFSGSGAVNTIANSSTNAARAMLNLMKLAVEFEENDRECKNRRHGSETVDRRKRRIRDKILSFGQEDV